MSAVRALVCLALAAILPLAAGCDEKSSAGAPPAPREVSGGSIAEFCNMSLDEHPGPKGQIFVMPDPRPFWFASVHDTFAFLMLPDTPKAVQAVYVNDMAKAKSWDQPEPGTWVDARKAVYVIESRRRGGMGEAEAVPFSDRAAAQLFIDRYGGRLVSFEDMPRDYILAGGNAPPNEAQAPPESGPGSPAQETSHDDHAR